MTGTGMETDGRVIGKDRTRMTEKTLDYAHCAGVSLSLSAVCVPALLLTAGLAPVLDIALPRPEKLGLMAAVYVLLGYFATRLILPFRQEDSLFSPETAKRLLGWRVVLLLGEFAVSGWSAAGLSPAAMPLLTLSIWLGALIEGACLGALARLEGISLSGAAAVSLRCVFPNKIGKKAAGRKGGRR